MYCAESVFLNQDLLAVIGKPKKLVNNYRKLHISIRCAYRPEAPTPYDKPIENPKNYPLFKNRINNLWNMDRITLSWIKETCSLYRWVDNLNNKVKFQIPGLKYIETDNKFILYSVVKDTAYILWSDTEFAVDIIFSKVETVKKIYCGVHYGVIEPYLNDELDRPVYQQKAQVELVPLYNTGDKITGELIDYYQYLVSTLEWDYIDLKSVIDIGVQFGNIQSLDLCNFITKSETSINNRFVKVMVKTDSIKTDSIKTDSIKTDSIKTDSIKTDSNIIIIATDYETKGKEGKQNRNILNKYRKLVELGDIKISTTKDVKQIRNFMRELKDTQLFKDFIARLGDKLNIFFLINYWERIIPDEIFQKLELTQITVTDKNNKLIGFSLTHRVTKNIISTVQGVSDIAHSGLQTYINMLEIDQWCKTDGQIIIRGSYNTIIDTDLIKFVSNNPNPTYQIKQEVDYL